MARRGVFAAPADEPPPPLALVFAGQGSQYVGMSRELYETFPAIRSWMDRIAAVADFDLLDLLFNSAEEDLQKTRWQQPALYTMEYAMVQHLMSLGVRPKAMAGHSLGELVALSVAGVFSFEDGFRIVNKRAECMDKASGMRQDPGTMIAVDGPMELLEAKVAERNNVFFTNFNAPHQVVLGGGTAEVMDLMEDLKREGYRATRLKVSMAFHSPVMRVIHEEMADFVSGIAFHSPGIPVVSNTTMEPFTDDPDQIRRTLMAHLESPVHWMQNVTSLWEDFGVRVFMEIGPRDTLCNLVGDTLGQAVCIPTCMPEREAHTYRSGIARLFALGHLEPDEGAVVPSPKALPPSRTPMRPQSPPVDRVAAVVQREINAFLMESFGKFLKPQILEAVRREVDPSFDEDRLNHLFSTGFLADQLPPPAPPASDEAVSARARPSGVHDYLEELIHIIMDATGYERDEIEPDMDIRQDLAIRSSRLPVIMDAAERHFGISMNMEDYFGLRTVREVADHIAQSAAGGQAVFDSRLPASAPEARGPSAAPETGPPLPLKRLAFQEVRLSDPPGERLELGPGQKVALIRFQSASELFDKMERWAAQELKSGVLKWDMPKPEDMQGAEALADQIAREPALAGLVFIMDGAPEATLGMETVPSLLAQCFTILKGFMRAPDKVFCCLLHRPADSPEPAGIAAEGLLGMFLSAAHEYGSVQFRSLVLQDESDFREVMARALDTTLTEVALHHRGHETFCLEAFEDPFSLDADPAPILRAGDVIVISGGGRGITPHMARALAAFRPKLALLGRSPMDPDAAKGILQLDEAATEETLTQWVQRRDPGLHGDDLDEELRRVAAAVEIHRTLQTLNAEGIEAHYYTCDASDPVQVRETLRQVKTRHGRIDGIIHGAGILRDALLQDMTPEDFVSVVRVKVLGALNLFQAAGPDPLRFMLGLSSLSAVQGNPGQVNYCAANRALSAMMRAWEASTDDFAAKALMLPPIEGTGMAHDPELRALLRLKGMEGAYIHVNEMAELFCRELILGRPDQAWVLFARALPRVKTSRIHLEDPTPDSQDRSVAGLAFEPGAFPMVHKVDHVDLGRGELQLTRSFSPDYDLWLQDHRPFKLLRQPFFSGIMAVETFMEAARLLYPHLSVRGVRHVQYKDVLDCPPGVQRETRILCTRKERRGGEVVCSVSFTTADISPSGRRIERWTTNYEGDVILGADPSSLDNWPDFSVAAETFDTPSLLPGDILKAYEGGTALQGRYRVLETIEGTGPGTVKGSMVYPAEEDFAGLDGVRYQYSPYLLESLLHAVAFYALARESNGTWNMIPGGIQELRFARRCRPGERLILEARLRSEDDRGHAWDARALDEAGAPVLQVTGLTMMRFTR
jgi:malonyl CoA-acyl carrier protein transacylase